MVDFVKREVEPMDNLSEQFKALRMALNLNKTEFAQKLQTSISLISMIESGVRRPSVELMRRAKEQFSARFEI